MRLEKALVGICSWNLEFICLKDWTFITSLAVFCISYFFMSTFLFYIEDRTMRCENSVIAFTKDCLWIVTQFSCSQAWESLSVSLWLVMMSGCCGTQWMMTHFLSLSLAERSQNAAHESKQMFLLFRPMKFIECMFIFSKRMWRVHSVFRSNLSGSA